MYVHWVFRRLVYQLGVIFGGVMFVIEGVRQDFEWAMIGVGIVILGCGTLATIGNVRVLRRELDRQ